MFRTNKAVIFAFVSLTVLQWCGSSAHAEISDFSPINDGGAAARNLEQVRNRLHPVAWLGGNLPSSDSSSSSSLYEVKAVLQGRVGCGDNDTLLLEMKGNNIDAGLPHSYSPSWLGDAAQVRIILKDNLQADAGSASYSVVAIAPEYAVAAIDAPSSRSRERYVSFTSRSTSSRSFVSSDNLPKGHPACPLPDDLLAIYPYYRNSIAHYNPRLDDQTLDKITTSILAYSKYYQVDPRLIMAMIISESGFNPQSTSRTGAMGLGQLMPGTAAGLGVNNPYDPVQNVGAAVKILSEHVNQYGGATRDGLVPLNTLLLTMAAYNAGGGAVAKYHGVPPYRETQNYVRKVSDLYRRMCGG